MAAALRNGLTMTEGECNELCDDKKLHCYKDEKGNFVCVNENLASQYMRRYGNSAFGVISLLVLWFAIVRPELIHSRVQLIHLQQLVTEMQRHAIEQQKLVTEMQRHAIEQQKAFAVVVDNQRQIIENTTKLQKLVDKGC